jgi:protein-disulfide isomerase
MQEPRSPYFIPKPPPPPPPGPPPPKKSAGLLALGITLGVLVGVGVTGAVLLPSLLSKEKQEDPRDEEKPKKKEKPKKTDDSEPPVDTEVAIKILPSDPARGGKRPKVTVVEFSDFQCPFCMRASSTMDALLKKYGEDLRLVWKDNPLPFHKDALPAAKVAKTAYLDVGATAFWNLHDKIFANQKDLATDLATWALDVGVTASAATKLESSVNKAIDDSIALAKDVGATGTPCFFVDGERLSGAQPQTAFEKVIDAHLAEADALLAKGVSREDLYARLSAKHYDEPEPAAGTLYKVEAAGVAKWGADDALVTVVVYGDLAKPPFGGARATVADLVALGDTRVIFRDVPSTPASREAAAVVRAIGAKDPKERAKAIEDAWSGFPADLTTFGTDHGLTAAEAKKAIASAASDKSIDDDIDSASMVDVYGTQLFVNGRKQFSWSKADVTSTHAAEKKRAQKLVAKGIAPRDVYDELVKSGTSRAPKHVKLGVPAWAPSRGPSSAKVVIQVFSDFQCPFCKRAESKGGGFFDAVALHASDVRVVFRHNPLPFHPMAEPAAQLTLEAKAEKGDASFFRVHDALFAATTLDMTKLEAIATAEGLDLTKVRAAISTHKYKKIIDDDLADAKSVGISGTPAFVVGDELVSGAQTQSVFEAAIVRAKAKAP